MGFLRGWRGSFPADERQKSCLPRFYVTQKISSKDRIETKIDVLNVKRQCIGQFIIVQNKTDHGTCDHDLNPCSLLCNRSGGLGFC